MRKLLPLLLLVVLCGATDAAQSLPPAPARYFNDYTGTVRPDTAAALNSKLEQFEKETSIQVVVAMFSRMPDVDFEDYANRLFRSWKIGQASKNNGVLLLVFKDDRKLRIEVGYGLEGVLPDAVANRIITREIAPHFKSGNFDAGLTAGVNAILLATRGEYQGTGRTVASRRGSNPAPFMLVFIVVLFVFAMIMFGFARRATQYHRRRRNYWGPIWTSGWGGGGWGGGGGWSGGGGFSGGFSGGGGSSGGGGASGSW